MCGGSAPVDNSAAVAQIEAQTAREERERAEREAAQARADFEQRLGGAYTSGIESARQFFANQGLDPEQYIGAITNAANVARTTVPQLDGSPGTYFSNLGAQTFDQLQEAERARNLRNIDTFARQGFATERITNDVDDPFLSSILEERRAQADDYIRRLLDRGVITPTGYNAAIDDLNEQRANANLRLQDIGLAELERGRGSLRDIAASARSGASNANLGDGFDAFRFEGQLKFTRRFLC
jgi:hypothetical protein